MNLNAFQENIFDVFKIFDRKKQWIHHKKEIKFTFHNLGIELGDTEIDKIVEKADFNGRKMISFDVF